MRNFLSKFIRSTNTRRRRRPFRGKSIRRLTVPATEPLEARLVLATITWTGEGDSVSWADADNWDREGVAQVPLTGDDVVIPNMGDPAITGDVTISISSSVSPLNSVVSAESLSISNGLFSIAADSRIDGVLTLSGGTLTTNASLVIGDVFHWSAGTLTGSGMTVLEPDAVFKITAGSHRSEDHTITGDGTVEWSEGTVRGPLTVLADMHILGDADKSLLDTLNLRGTTTWNGTGRMLLEANSTPHFAVFNNQGLLKIESDAIVTSTNGGTTSLNNDGTIEVSSGTLRNEISSYWGTGSRIIGPGFVENAGTVQVTGLGVSVDNLRMVFPTSQLIVGHDLTIRENIRLAGRNVDRQRDDRVGTRCRVQNHRRLPPVRGSHDHRGRHRGVVRGHRPRPPDGAGRHADPGRCRQVALGYVEPPRYDDLERHRPHALGGQQYAALCCLQQSGPSEDRERRRCHHRQWWNPPP